MGLSIVTPAVEEPISLDETRAHLRVDLTDEDELIGSYIAAARTHLEGICGRSFVSTTWDYAIDYLWPWVFDMDTRSHQQIIELPRAPLASVTSITYVDGAGASQTLNSNQYIVDGTGAVGRIYPAYNVTWPTVRNQLSCATVRFVAGYGDAAAVPQSIKQALLLLTAHFYANREPVALAGNPLEVPMAVSSLIAPHRVYFQ
jgi:uncharacterized phiE125 gp8 family phage protein